MTTTTMRASTTKQFKSTVSMTRSKKRRKKKEKMRGSRVSWFRVSTGLVERKKKLDKASRQQLFDESHSLSTTSNMMAVKSNKKKKLSQKPDGDDKI